MKSVSYCFFLIFSAMCGFLSVTLGEKFGMTPFDSIAICIFLISSMGVILTAILSLREEDEKAK